jgi:DNA invertase Pin-like site-specific DNA recombinase
MHNADLITPQPLARKAVMYLRQSTPHHVLSHQESRRLPYALGARAHQLGWPDAAIAIMDDELGLTAATAHHRPGFHTLVAQVTLEQVGLIVSYDVTRLSRNGSDWYPLLDLCGYKGCWMADGDGSDAPATVNGRLLLGLQGTRSAWERHTMQARLTAGLLQQATRGEWALTLPPGWVRTSLGTGQKIPNQAAQARLSLVCETFLPWRSARKGVEVCNTHDRWLPRRNRFGALVWQAPRVAAGLAILKHPASAGAFT